MTCTVIVFAKAPVPGYAKTRLAKKIGNEEAAKLATRMLQEAIKQAVEANLGPVELCCAPDTSHPLFTQLQQQYGIQLTLQGDGDLGARMERALKRALLPGYGNHSQPNCAVLTGTDAPALDAAYLRAAALSLREQPAVFAPTADGGYALIGVAKHMPFLFEDMPWSTAAVMAETRQRLTRHHVSHRELPQLHDVDEPEDLIHVPPDWLL